MNGNDIGKIGDRIKRRKIARAKRIVKREKGSKNKQALAASLAKVQKALASGGEIQEFNGGFLIVQKGAEAIVNDQGTHTMLLVGPAAAIEEAMERIENPETPMQDPLDTEEEYAAALERDSDVTEGIDRRGLAKRMYDEDGCAMAHNNGFTMGECADEITGALPVVMALKAVPKALRALLSRIHTKRNPTTPEGEVVPQEVEPSTTDVSTTEGYTNVW